MPRKKGILERSQRVVGDGFSLDAVVFNDDGITALDI